MFKRGSEPEDASGVEEEFSKSQRLFQKSIRSLRCDGENDIPYLPSA
jgi:hypothetical protein